MFKQSFIKIAFFGALAASSLTSAADICMPIGGVGMPNFVAQPDGSFAIVAPLTGSVSNASGKVTAQRETATGLEMDMEHYFMTDKGGFMHTKDLGILTKVEGKKDRYMIEISYDIQNKESRGNLEGYKGSFKSFGLVDLRNLTGLIRYSGKICK
jgi:hypothetical protein